MSSKKMQLFNLLNNIFFLNLQFIYIMSNNIIIIEKLLFNYTINKKSYIYLFLFLFIILLLKLIIVL